MHQPSVPTDLPQIIAHRGESGLAPENTLSALSLAATNGASWAEIDVNISSDGIPYVHHDDSLDRCTTGKGYLIASTSRELDQLDAGLWFSETYRDEPLPTLSAVHSLLFERRIGLNLEIKPTCGWEVPTTDAICDFIESEWKASVPLLISSFSTKALKQARLRLPAVPMGLLVCAIPPDWKQEMLDLNCQSLHCDAVFLTEELATEIKKEGYKLLCYTVNDSIRAAELLSWGVDSVITDFPSRLTKD